MLALVLFFFLVVASVFKFIVENTKHLLRKYKRDAMVVGRRPLAPAGSLSRNAAGAAG